jgi:hypothetical protein
MWMNVDMPAELTYDRVAAQHDVLTTARSAIVAQVVGEPGEG